MSVQGETKARRILGLWLGIARSSLRKSIHDQTTQPRSVMNTNSPYDLLIGQGRSDKKANLHRIQIALQTGAGNRSPNRYTFRA